jgi:hypothetical protein
VAQVDELGFGMVGEGVRHGGEASTPRGRDAYACKAVRTATPTAITATPAS